MPSFRNSWAALPAFVPLLLPSAVDEAPAGDGWLHEIKHDGFRTLLAIGGGRARCYTRRGHDWSDRYARVAEAASRLACRSALIDGEVVAQDAAGRSSLEALHEALASEPHRIVFFAFDFLQLDGADLCPLSASGAQSASQEADRRG
jgi:bifunctional non-homologous end joining protein LigD